MAAIAPPLTIITIGDDHEEDEITKAIIQGYACTPKDSRILNIVGSMVDRIDARIDHLNNNFDNDDSNDDDQNDQDNDEVTIISSGPSSTSTSSSSIITSNHDVIPFTSSSSISSSILDVLLTTTSETLTENEDTTPSSNMNSKKRKIISSSSETTFEKESKRFSSSSSEKKYVFDGDFCRAVTYIFLRKLIYNYKRFAMIPNPKNDPVIEEFNQKIKLNIRKLSSSRSSCQQVHLLPLLDALSFFNDNDDNSNDNEDEKDRLSSSSSFHHNYYHHNLLLTNEDFIKSINFKMKSDFNLHVLFDEIFTSNNVEKEEDIIAKIETQFKIDWRDHRVYNILWGWGCSISPSGHKREHHHHDPKSCISEYCLNLPELISKHFTKHIVTLSGGGRFKQDTSLSQYIYQVHHSHNHRNLSGALSLNEQDRHDRVLTSKEEVEAVDELNFHMRRINKEAWSQLVFYTMESLCGYNPAWNFVESWLDDCTTDSWSDPAHSRDIRRMTYREQLFSKFGFASMHLLYCKHYNCLHIPIAIPDEDSDDGFTIDLLNNINKE
jgi:hypothetical protein